MYPDKTKPQNHPWRYEPFSHLESIRIGQAGDIEIVKGWNDLILYNKD